ncbi:phage tail protein [Anaerospora hongkongensis]|uniref:phage tail protein n=1 Tax=Anaerospora hongkongensis TaxID=244830 RepID=UPI002FD9607F
MIIWPIAAMPTGNEQWLECNGQPINSLLYPELAALMSNTPDYRGIFLRGNGSVTSMHYGAVTHSSGNLNELQGDAIRNIDGGFIGGNPGYYPGDSNYGAFTLNHTLQAWVHIGANSYQDYAKYSFSASNVVPIANENRPINKAVKYLIRAK